MRPKNISPRNISLGIALVVTVWIATGYLTGTSRGEGAAPPGHSGEASAGLLKIEAMDARPFKRQITLNGYTEAHRMVEMKPEVEGKVAALPVTKGERVEAGQVVVRLDDRDRKEKLAEAKANLARRSLEYQAAQELEMKGYRPRIGLAESRANLEQARVQLAQAQLNADNTEVRAPFAGRLEELNVEIGDFVLSGFFGSMDGKVMARLVEDDPIKVLGKVSEKDLPSLNRDAPVEVILSDGRSFSGRISFVSQYADKESRSFDVEVQVTNARHDIPVGMTATMKLPSDEGTAYRVSSSVLALDDAGKVGVKLVDEAGMVEFRHVTILASDEDGLWIGGLPERIRLVSQGQAFINAGQRVPEAQEAP